MYNHIYYVKGNKAIGSIRYNRRSERFTVFHNTGSKAFDNLREAKAYMDKHEWTNDPDITGILSFSPRIVYRNSQNVS